MVKSFTVVKAVLNFKGLASARRLGEREAKRQKAMEAKLSMKLEGATTDAQLALLLDATKETKAALGKEIEDLKRGLDVKALTATITENLTKQLSELIAEQVAKAMREETTRKQYDVLQ